MSKGMTVGTLQDLLAKCEPNDLLCIEMIDKSQDLNSSDAVVVTRTFFEAPLQGVQYVTIYMAEPASDLSTWTAPSYETVLR
jgi:hypothetical protein